MAVKPKLRRRRTAKVPRFVAENRDRSDLTATAGRLWSPLAAWNLPVPMVPADTGSTAKYRDFEALAWAVDIGAPDVQYVGPAGMSRVGRPWRVYVDLTARTVACGEVWNEPAEGRPDLTHVPLDGDGWGSRAVGLVLQRELLGRSGIQHAVGLSCPDMDLYGLRVRLRAPKGETFKALSPAARLVAQALATYGGVFVTIADGPPTVRCEHSTAATSADRVGPLYRGVGIADDRAPVGIPAAWLEVFQA